MSAHPTHAMLLAAGRGERLRPLTDRIPKPLVEVAGRSLLDRQLDRLEAYGIAQVVVNTAWLAESVERHLAARRSPDIILSRESEALETGGGVRHALPLLGQGPFFVMNSDVILLDGTTPALTRLAEAWDDTAYDALLLLQPCERAAGFAGAGDFFLDGIQPRRRGEAVSAPYVFTGTQILSPRLFEASPEGAFSMNQLYDRHRADDGTLGRVGALVHDGDWLHVGDREGLSDAERYFATPAFSTNSASGRD